MDLELEIIRQPISPYFLESNKTFEYFVIFFLKTSIICSVEIYILCSHFVYSKRQGPFMEEIFRERERERGERGSRGKRLRKEITLKSNFRVNSIWVGWVNFNLGGFFIYLDWVNFLGNCLYFLGGYLLGLSIYACLDRMCALFSICLTQ